MWHHRLKEHESLMFVTHQRLKKPELALEHFARFFSCTYALLVLYETADQSRYRHSGATSSETAIINEDDRPIFLMYICTFRTPRTEGLVSHNYTTQR